MGYDTYYSLYVRRKSDPFHDVDLEKDEEAQRAIDDLRANNEHAQWAFEEDGTTRQEVRHWDTFEEDFIDLSKKYPDLVFCVFGDGDASDDKWEAWFHNGEAETCYMIIPNPKMFNKRKTVDVGCVGVDSGQLIICDPSYIDSQWEKDSKQRSTHQIYKHSDGSLWQFKFPGTEQLPDVNPFPGTFDDPIPQYDNLSPNQLIESGAFTKSDKDPFEDLEENFSFDAVSRITLGNPGYGQLFYNMGHPGVGVAIGSFGGDGVYPVEAEIEDGLVKRIIVTLND